MLVVLLISSQSHLGGGKNQKILISGVGLYGQGGSMGFNPPQIQDTVGTSCPLGLCFHPPSMKTQTPSAATVCHGAEQSRFVSDRRGRKGLSLLYKQSPEEY